MTLGRLANGMLLLLGVEFVLGTVLGLFVTLPSGAGVVAVLSSSIVLELHIVVAVLLIGISIRALALSVGRPDWTVRYAAALALVSALTATLAGWVFAFDGQNPNASLVMALGFLGVLGGAFLLRDRASEPGRRVRPDSATREQPAASTEVGR
ncbi:MAG: hypothetical protein ACREDE_00175 [Thermoplasmata archaeon]